MRFREAAAPDFIGIHAVRIAVKENILPDPGMITESDYIEYLANRGKGWVCETDNTIVGFSIVDVVGKNVWALFVAPGYEGRGIGKKLHTIMMEWYFTQTEDVIWLGTSPCTRAEKFYRNMGWKEVAIRPNGEIRFEMTIGKWRQSR